jgi:MFS transporter, DHA1 family, inner membrane transport protein
LIHTAWIGALVVLVALALTYWSGRLDRNNPAMAVSAEGSAPLASAN